MDPTFPSGCTVAVWLEGQHHPPPAGVVTSYCTMLYFAIGSNENGREGNGRFPDAATGGGPDASPPHHGLASRARRQAANVSVGDQSPREAGQTGRRRGPDATAPDRGCRGKSGRLGEP